MAWAERTWQMLVDAGLTAYADDVERTRVLLRLVALAMIYRDFCWVGRDESWDQSTLIITANEELELARLRIGQLVGPRWDADTFDSTDDDLVEAAILEITDAERANIGPVLVKGFGHEVALADALCRTSATATVDDEDEHESRGLNDEDFTTAARIYEWIDQGMQRI